LDQSPKADLHGDECEAGNDSATIREASSFKPTIIKAGEIIAVEVTFGYPPKEAVTTPLPHPIPIEKDSASKKQINVLGCLRFKIGTTDKVDEFVDVPIYYSKIELYMQSDGYFGAATTPRLEPRILVRSSWPF